VTPNRAELGPPVNGWLVLDKSPGMTSAFAVARAKRLFGAAKAGHAGTLDPLATGVLPIAFGEATKTMAYVMDAPKTYRFTVRWGEARATDDSEGAVTATSPARPGEAQIRAALPQFRGEISQVPPTYSAIKLAGKPAYARARRGEPVCLAARAVRIESFELEAAADADHATFCVQCGKGTYIRGLTRDLAVALGTVGHVAALRRLAVGRFVAGDAITLDKLDALGHSAARLGYLRPVETALDDIPALAVTEADSLRLRQGQAVRVPGAADTGDGRRLRPGQVVCATSLGRVVALARIEGESLRPLRVLNL
jgi:tRNA pseudouridine55 synthase